VTMIIRTYYEKGLLFYISNPLDSAFMAVQLADDDLSVLYSPDMQSVDTVVSDAHVTDGAWHTVSFVAVFFHSSVYHYSLYGISKYAIIIITVIIIQRSHWQCNAT